MTQLAARTGVSDTYPLPSNATAKAALAAMWDVINEMSQAAEIDLASAATTNIGVQVSRKLRITGTTGITSLGTTYTGPIVLRFSGALTITHHATTLICPGGANLTVAAGDVVIATPKCTASGAFDGWMIVARPDSQVAAINGDATEAFSALAINTAKTTVASATTPDIFAATTGQLIDYTGTATATGFAAAPQGGMFRELYCAGACSFTAGANLLIDGITTGYTITLAAGAVVKVRSITTTQFEMSVSTFFKSSSPTIGIGYGDGAGGMVTQVTSKSTGVTLNKITGLITTHAASLGAGATVTFYLTNTTIESGDVVVANICGSGTYSAYQVTTHNPNTGGCYFNLRNVSGGALAEGLDISFCVLKASWN